MGPLPVTQPRAGPRAFVASLLTSAGHPASAASEPRVLAGHVFCTLPPASCTLALAPRPPEAGFVIFVQSARDPSTPLPSAPPVTEQHHRGAPGETLRVPSGRPFLSLLTVPKVWFALAAFLCLPLPLRLSLCGVHALWTHASGCGTGPWSASPAHTPDTHARHPETKQAVVRSQHPRFPEGGWGASLVPCSGPSNRSGGKPGAWLC